MYIGRANKNRFTTIGITIMGLANAVFDFIVVVVGVFILVNITVFGIVLLVPSSPPSPIDAIPEPYYNCVPNPNLTFEDLNVTVNEAAVPREYERDVWDCSESSAWMEWYLERRGFDAYIVTNRFPIGDHAYVMVRFGNDSVYFIESTPDPFFYSNNSYYAYAHYDRCYDDIYDATRNGVSTREWDWWCELNISAF